MDHTQGAYRPEENGRGAVAIATTDNDADARSVVRARPTVRGGTLRIPVEIRHIDWVSCQIISRFPSESLKKADAPTASYAIGPTSLLLGPIFSAR